MRETTTKTLRRRRAGVFEGRERERERGWHRAQKRFVFNTTSRKVKVKMHKSLAPPIAHKKSFFTKRNMPKNALSRPTAAALLSAAAAAAALFCVVELAFARETQYFYNSVTGEVRVVRATSLFSNPIFSYLSLDPVSFCDRMCTSNLFSGLSSVVVSPRPRRPRDQNRRERSFLFFDDDDDDVLFAMTDFLCMTFHSNITTLYY